MKTMNLLLFVGLFSINNLFGADVVLNNFESGSPTVTTKYGSTYVNEANPTVSGLNTTANCGKIGRTTSLYWELIYFPASFTVPANTSKYVHVMVKYAAQPDISIRVNAATAGADGSGDIRAINKYTNIGQWQDLVFKVTAGTTAINVIQINYLADLGFENTPAGRILNNSTAYGYLDEVIVSDTDLPRGTTFMTGNKIYDFETPTTGIFSSISTYSDANNMVTYPVVNPFMSGINTSNNVGKRASLANPSNWYAGFTTTLSNPILVDANHKYLHVMVAVPVDGQKVTFNVTQGATVKINDAAGLTTITTANTWQDVVLDVSAMQYISGISLKCGNFTASSTAAGDYYFDEFYIDGNAAPRVNIATGVSVSTKNNAKVFASNKKIYIENAGSAPKSLMIYNVNGQNIVTKNIINSDIVSMKAAGLYFVKIGNETTKVVVE